VPTEPENPSYLVSVACLCGDYVILLPSASSRNSMSFSTSLLFFSEHNLTATRGETDLPDRWLYGLVIIQWVWMRMLKCWYIY